MADGAGRVIHSQLEHAGQRLQRPFLWGDHVYALSYGGHEVETVRFSVERNGTASGFERIGKTPVAQCWNLLATCVFRGNAYLFYDRKVDGARWWYHIRYKVSPDPTKGWEPPGEEGHDTGHTAEYAYWGLRKTPASLAARELGDRLFVIYYREDQLHYITYDGRQWTEHPPLLPEKYHPNFAVTNATLGGRPVLIIAGRTHAHAGLLALTALAPDLTVTQLGTVYMDGVDVDNVFSLAHGSISGDAQESVLQIFGINSSGEDLRRLSFSLEGRHGIGEWVDSTIRSTREEWAFCDTVTVPIPVETGARDVRLHHVVLARHGEVAGGLAGAYHVDVQTASVYPSDYFHAADDDVTIDTGRAGAEERGAWTLLGVVEGVPPFTRNGVTGEDAVSSISYERSQEREFTQSVAYEATVSTSVNGGVEGVASVSITAAGSFGTANAQTARCESQVTDTLDSTDLNRDGAYGWRLFSVPRLVTRRYQRLTHDRSLVLGTFVLVTVAGATVTLEPYRLADPPAGMRRRPASTDVAAWQAIESPSRQEGIDLIELDMLVGSLFGQAREVSVKRGASDERSTSGTAKVTVKQSTKVAEWLQVELEGGFSFEQKRTVTLRRADGLTAKLDLPNPGKPGRKVVRVEVAPYWLVPCAGATLTADLAAKLGWIAEDARANGVVPWCLTWKVTRVDSADE